MGAELVDPVLGHHAAGGEVAVAGPVEAGHVEREAVEARHLLQHLEARVDHLGADPVAGDEGYGVAAGHRPSPPIAVYFSVR